jgi:hypothetical protein
MVFLCFLLFHSFACAYNLPLPYQGGPVITNVQIVMVLYGNGTYLSEIMSDKMEAFYSQLVLYYLPPLLREYSIPNQAILPGNFLQKVQIVPLEANSGTLVLDNQIANELVRQIELGTLPSQSHILYAIHFPQEILVDSLTECLFCGYHSSFLLDDQPVVYAVLPDLSHSSLCGSECGTGQPFDNQCTVVSHEVAESITDPGVGYNALGWFEIWNNMGVEIADICDLEEVPFVGMDGIAYTAQKIYSNLAKGCVYTNLSLLFPSSSSKSCTCPTIKTSTSVTMVPTLVPVLLVFMLLYTLRPFI